MKKYPKKCFFLMSQITKISTFEEWYYNFMNLTITVKLKRGYNVLSIEEYNCSLKNFLMKNLMPNMAKKYLTLGKNPNPNGAYPTP